MYLHLLQRKMEIVIIDPKKWLSKRQRQKIRAGIMSGRANEEILNEIEYRQGEGRYATVERTDDENSKITTLSFTDVDPRAILRQKLRSRLANIRGKRTGHRLESWRRYYELINIPQLQSIVPDPPTIIKNVDQFQVLRSASATTGWFVKYVDLCIADKDQLSHAYPHPCS